MTPTAKVLTQIGPIHAQTARAMVPNELFGGTVIPRCLFVGALLCGCQVQSADTEPVQLVGEWHGCASYPAGDRTCDELCASVGKGCLARGCDGVTLQKYVLPRCSSAGSYDRDYDISCDEIFDVSTSSSSSAECCCV